MKIKQTENEVKSAIKQYLELHGYKVYRINNGGVYRGKNKDGATRFSFAGDAGVADLYAIGMNTLWVEAKATGRKPSATQLEFGMRVNKTLGAAWLWADSLDMFIDKEYNHCNLPE